MTEVDEINVLLIFTNTEDNKSIFKSDSCLWVWYFSSPVDSDCADYKGIIRTDSVNLVIFDTDGIGESFYDKNSLEAYPLDSLHQFPQGFGAGNLYRIRGNELELWIGP